MELVRVISCTSGIVFSNGVMLTSYHDQECCETHYLSFDDLSLDDFNGLLFDISGDDFFERVEGYGIALKSTNGWPVRIPGYGCNNGYYSSDLSIHMSDGRVYDISDCQSIDW
jgi:hypothetical protein